VTLRFKIWFCGAGGINSFDPFNQQVWERKTKFHPYCVCALVFTSPSREIYSSFSRNENRVSFALKFGFVELEGLIPLIPSISRCGREKPNFIHTAYAPLFSLRLPEKFIPPSAEMKTE